MYVTSSAPGEDTMIDLSVTDSTYFTITQYDSKPSSLEYEDIDGGFKLKWKSAPDAQRYEVRVDDEEKGTTEIYNTTDTQMSLIGMGYGKGYFVYVRGVHGIESSEWVKFNYRGLLTMPKEPDLYVYSKDGKVIAEYTQEGSFYYISFMLCDKDGNRIKVDGKYVNTSVYASAGSAGRVVFDSSKGVTQNGEYIVKANTFQSFHGYGRFSITIQKKVVVCTILPQKWYWDPSTNTEADTNIIQGTRLGEASGKKYFAVTAREWNNFTTRINAFRNYKGYLSYNFTNVKQGDVFTADIYDEALEAVAEMGLNVNLETALKYITRITAAHFLLLADAINGIE